MKPECDIILLSYESPDLLKKCVQSVLEHTRVPARLIIVDNGSRDPEVARYLHALRGSGTVTVEKLFSEANEGFAAGMNKGMRLSDAPFLCLLNNDCVVTDGWLEEMIAVARGRDDIGLVDPQSNTFGSWPDGGASANEHAALLQDKKGKFVELGHAVAFACLIKREVVERVGYLDEAYQGVCYEDTDYSVRARKAGFIPVMAEASYVFHEEQASRKKLEDKEEIYRRNKKIYEGRWGRLLRIFFLDRLEGSDERLFENYEALKGIARESAIVDMWVKAGVSAGASPAGFDEGKIIGHADIRTNVFSEDLIAPAVLWQVLTKKKKYDAVIMDDSPLLRLLRLLKPLHGAEVFSAEDGTLVRSGKTTIFDLRDPARLAAYLRRGA